MKKINRKKASNWITRNHLMLKNFDKNQDGVIDDYELEDIYATLVDYISRQFSLKWFYTLNVNSEELGPEFIDKIPVTAGMYVRPEDSAVWVPYELIEVAQKDDFKPMPNHSDRVLTSSSEFIHGYTIVEHKGLVWGITVRAKDFVTDFLSGIKQFFGGELDGYTQLAIDAKQEAVDRMIASARRWGANAIIRVSFDSGGAGTGAAEITAYGTAVVIEPEE